MKWQVLGALVAAVTALGVGAAPAGAAATSSGNETLKGSIVTSGRSGTRTVISSVVVAKGAFRGAGRIIEIPNLPTDPENVSRDDLVFRGGSMHLVSTNLDGSSSLNPHSCLLRVTIQQTGEVTGGTGQFAAASGNFAATVSAQALLARHPDGSCSDEQDPLHEVDQIESRGTLSS
jgi:hypothetical protein